MAPSVMKRVLVGLVVLLLGALMVAGVLAGRQRDRMKDLESKAKRFDQYCLSVHSDLGFALSKMKHEGIDDARDRVAYLFYKDHWMIDRGAVQRCADPSVTAAAVEAIRSRCAPKDLCAVAPPEDETCRVRPECLASVLQDLMNLFPKR